MEIIIDAMGGDHAPYEIVKGALLGLETFPDIRIKLTGDPKMIEEITSGIPHDAARLSVVPTTQVIEMDDSPVKVLKEKPDSSMVVAFHELSKTPGGIMMSAGLTGALVAGGTLLVGRIRGVKRPALTPVLPAKTGKVLLIDGGANADCKPMYLNQFGIMGSIYMNKVLGIENPRVALVNNGSEPEKGSELTKEAYKLLEKAPINFVGNVEGRDLLSGDYDVLVCDGFTGNIILKNVEGSAKLILGMMKEYIKESGAAKLGAVLMKGVFSKLKKKMDYKEVGGSLLLGLKGGVMKMHGSSDAHAVLSAVKIARDFILGDVVNVIEQEIQAVPKES